MGFYKKCSAINSAYMELLAFKYGIIMANDHHMHNLEVETDSTEVIQLLSDNYNYDYNDLLQNCSYLLKNLGNP